MTTHSKAPIARRFRGFLPVVVDLETGGFNSDTDAILEMAVIMIDMEEDGRVFIYAARTIQPREELTYDYRLNVDGRAGKKLRKAYACHCGSDNCRGTMLEL